MTALPATMRLRASTREVGRDDPILLRDHTLDASGFAWLHEGARIVATGVAARVPADEAVDALRAVDTDDPVARPGTGPLAVGCLPFDPAAPAHLVVPARVTAVVGGRAFVTEIETLGPAPARPAPRPHRYTVSSTRTYPEWHAMVDAALAEIRDNALDKVVLAREVVVETEAPFAVHEIVDRLVSQQPGCFVYAAEGLVGASPELLVRRIGTAVESRPVAGTAVADGDDASLRALAESVKDHREHGFVVEAILGTLGEHCAALHASDTPEVAVFGHVAHLATHVHGRLRTPGPDAVELARLLHPSPAVGGTPRRAALDTIRRLEGFDRGRYAGPVGWVDARGDGEWAIAIRGAEIDGSRARLVAGAGIVEGSDPEAEWAETQAKFEPMLRALVRP